MTCGVMAIISDFESEDRGSSPCGSAKAGWWNRYTRCT